MLRASPGATRRCSAWSRARGRAARSWRYGGGDVADKRHHHRVAGLLAGQSSARAASLARRSRPQMSISKAGSTVAESRSVSPPWPRGGTFSENGCVVALAPASISRELIGPRDAEHAPAPGRPASPRSGGPCSPRARTCTSPRSSSSWKSSHHGRSASEAGSGAGLARARPRERRARAPIVRAQRAAGEQSRAPGRATSHFIPEPPGSAHRHRHTARPVTARRAVSVPGLGLQLLRRRARLVLGRDQRVEHRHHEQREQRADDHARDQHRADAVAGLGARARTRAPAAGGRTPSPPRSSAPAAAASAPPRAARPAFASPRACSVLANSTIRMPFLAISPTSVISPTCE